MRKTINSAYARPQETACDVYKKKTRGRGEREKERLAVAAVVQGSAQEKQAPIILRRKHCIHRR